MGQRKGMYEVGNQQNLRARRAELLAIYSRVFGKEYDLGQKRGVNVNNIKGMRQQVKLASDKLQDAISEYETRGKQPSKSFQFSNQSAQDFKAKINSIKRDMGLE